VSALRGLLRRARCVKASRQVAICSVRVHGHVRGCRGNRDHDRCPTDDRERPRREVLPNIPRRTSDDRSELPPSARQHMAGASNTRRAIRNADRLDTSSLRSTCTPVAAAVVAEQRRPRAAAVVDQSELQSKPTSGPTPPIHGSANKRQQTLFSSDCSCSDPLHKLCATSDPTISRFPCGSLMFDTCPRVLAGYHGFKSEIQNRKV
jgi:hypothetical protein